ncbi:MAG: cation diffusion facilitator family transporter [Muribaculaceae bacterium]|nr:cation diffusion facilitator family transporter [Muribaculaceae bacterium]
MLFHHDHSDRLSDLLTNDTSATSRKIRKIVIVGCIVNACLMALKLSVGYFGHSDALVADGFHSLNDFAADLIMLLFIGISFRDADSRYSYGYGKFETFSTFLISLFLLFISWHIAEEAIDRIKEYMRGKVLAQPDIWTVIVVLVSMCAKEFLFRFYRRGAKKTSTMALLTNAWHHRSDAMASIATLIGVSFAHFLGEPWRILDPCASLVLVVFIVVAAIRMLYPSFIELMDHSCPAPIADKARDIVEGTEGVERLLETKSRKNGHFLIFDFKIGVAPKLNVTEAEEIASRVQDNLKKEFGNNTLISVQTVPTKVY